MGASVTSACSTCCVGAEGGLGEILGVHAASVSGQASAWVTVAELSLCVWVQVVFQV